MKGSKFKRSKEHKSEPINNDVATEEAQLGKQKRHQVEVVELVVSPVYKQFMGANVAPKKRKRKIFKEEEEAASVPNASLQKEKVSEILTSL